MNESRSKRHIQETGAQAGQWVACQAENECRLGGEHVDDVDLKGTQRWVYDQSQVKKPLALLSLEEIDAYREASKRGYIPAPFVSRRQAKSDAYKAAVLETLFQRLEEQPVMSKPAATSFSATMKENVYNRIRAFAASSGVILQHQEAARMRSGLFGFGGDKLVHGSFELRGDVEDVQKVKQFVESELQQNPVELWGF